MKTLLWWFGVSFDYLAAGGLIALGVWCSLYWQHRFARIVGMMMLGAGIGWGCFAYGKNVGGTHVYAEWRAANMEAERVNKARDADLAKQAKAIADKHAAELDKLSTELNQKVADYEDAAKKLADAKCRVATPDDIRRLRSITGDAAKKGKRSK